MTNTYRPLEEKRGLAQAYFIIRAASSAIAPDKEYPRFHEPLRTYNEAIDPRTTSGDITNRLTEEMIIIRTAIQDAKHDASSSRREREILREMVARAHSIYGIPLEELRKKPNP